MNKMFAIFVAMLMVFAISGTVMAGSNTANANNAARSELEQNFNGTSFPGGTEINFPGNPNYFGPDKPAANTMDLRTILNLKPNWNRSQLKATTEKAKTSMRARFFVPTAKRKGDPTDSLMIYLGAPPENSNLVGVVMVCTRDTEATTLEVMADAGLAGLDIPGAALYIVAYGSSKVVKTGGWGIGFHSSAATLNGGNDMGTVTSGGTGWSTGEAGNKDKPWVHAYIVVTP